MPDTATIKQLLEAGVHFGHQTSRWHPHMKQYIFTKRNGIHIIDLEQTASMLDKACKFITQVVAGGGHILFVGTIEPRKNIQGLIKAFNYLKKILVEVGRGRPLQLYIAGMKGWMYEDIFKEYENSAFKEDIIFKGYVSDSELAELYRNASVFVYPSFYEGFGFPILEAFGHGVPVITSKTSSCGEIAGNRALLINPENYKEIGEAILKVINSEALRQELIRKGLERAKTFSWEKTAKEFISVFR